MHAHLLRSHASNERVDGVHVTWQLAAEAETLSQVSKGCVLRRCLHGSFHLCAYAVVDVARAQPPTPLPASRLSPALHMATDLADVYYSMNVKFTQKLNSHVWESSAHIFLTAKRQVCT